MALPDDHKEVGEAGHTADHNAIIDYILAHDGGSDPHPGYQKESEKSAASGYASLSAGTTVPLAELPTGTTAATVALGNAAAGLLATHAAAGDPHAGYQLESEKAAASGYPSLGTDTIVPPAQLGTGSPSASTFLRGDKSWVAVSGGATPASTVTDETTFGVAKAVGNLTGYAREDHTHGSPVDPVTAHAAAADPHAVYDLATDVDAKVAAHAGTADPHVGYQLESEKGVASGYAGLGSDGFVPTAQLGTGTPSDVKFLRGDKTWALAGAGVGVPVGGTTGEVLAKASATDYDTEWAPASGGLCDIQTFTSNGTWTKPTGPQTVAMVTLYGGGGGGGSGRRGAAGTARAGGCGGSGARGIRVLVPLTALAASEAVVVGLGGVGGTAIATDDTDGATGADGGSTTFGGLEAHGGTGGHRGQATAWTPSYTSKEGNVPGGYGGANSVTGNVADTLNEGADTCGGGAGGGISVANATYPGADGGVGGGGAWGGDGGGYHDVGDPAVNLTTDYVLGGSGGGGSAGEDDAGSGVGGKGGKWGGGGGGGGATLNGYAPGAGGAGGDGVAVIICF